MEPISVVVLANLAVQSCVHILKKGADGFVGEAGKDAWKWLRNKLSRNTEDARLLHEFETNFENQEVQKKLETALIAYLDKNNDDVRELHSVVNITNNTFGHESKPRGAFGSGGTYTEGTS